MAFCIPKHLVSNLKSAIKDGTLHPDKLVQLTSTGRRDLFAEIVGGENAKALNLAFEQKLLLKNQEKAMVDWARDALGLSTADKEALTAKIQATYLEKKRRIFTPEEDESFLNEVTSAAYSRKYKTDISLEEAEKITEYSRDVSKAREKVDEFLNEDGTWKSKEDQAKFGYDFGAKKVILDKYIGKLKTEAEKDVFLNPLKEKSFDDKLGAVGTDVGIAFNFIADNTRAIQASWDNSFWGRQGFKAMTNPKYTKLWAQNFAKSFSDITQVLTAGLKGGETFKGASILKRDAILDAVKADIFSRPNYLNGRYEMGTKLSVGLKEEEFPTSLPQKIPLLGRVFSASETAYEAGAMRLRVDIADKLYEIAGKQGIDLKDPFEVGSINQMVNSLTGRGKLRVGEDVQGLVNRTFFAPKNVKSHIDFLTAHAGQKMSKFSKKQARQNILTSIGSIGAVLVIANALWPGSIEWDPRSSDFGKIKIGNTRFDVTGGMGSYVSFISRMITGEKKSTTTGLLQKKGEKFGSGEKMDFLWDFTENKFSPAASLLKDLWQGTDFKGEPISKVDTLLQSVIPIPLGSAYETFKDPNAAPLLIAILADAFGFGTSTYGPEKSEAEATYEKMLNLSEGDREDALKELEESDPDFYKEVLKAQENYELGITPLDEAIKQMDIKNTERALYIAEQAEKFETPEEKNAYIDSLVTKGILDLSTTKDGKPKGSGWEILDQLKEIKDAGGVEAYKNRDITDDEDYVDDRESKGFISGQLIGDYIEAFKTNPGNAWTALTTKEKLGVVEGNLVELQRFYGLEHYEPGGSDEYKKKLMEAAGIPLSEIDDWKLEHIVPVKTGGGTDAENLYLEETALHDSYSSVEKKLAAAVKDEKLTTEEVAALMYDLKVRKIITTADVEAIIDAK